MPTITLDDVIAEQQRLAAMIEAFKDINGKVEILIVPEACIEMRPGERYAGLLLKPDGTPSHHLVLLPDKTEDLSWQAAIDWAAKVGGELPTRREQALLYANLKDEFKPEWHWSSELYESNSSSAWSQLFDYGDQSFNHEDRGLQARAVRRFPV